MEKSFDLFDMIDSKKEQMQEPKNLDKGESNELFNLVDNLNPVAGSRYPVCMEGSPLDQLQKKFGEEFDKGYHAEESAGLIEGQRANYINENVNKIQDYLGADVDLNDARQLNARLGLGEKDEFNIADNLNNVENSPYPICVKDSPLDQVQNKLAHDFHERHPECSRKETNEFINKNINQLQNYLGENVDMNNAKQVEERMTGQRIDRENGQRSEIEMIRDEMHSRLDRENLTGALKEQGHKEIDRMPDNRVSDIGHKLNEGRSDNMLLKEVYGKEKADELIRQSSQPITSLFGSRNYVSPETQTRSEQEVSDSQLGDKYYNIEEFARKQREKDEDGVRHFDSKELVR